MIALRLSWILWRQRLWQSLQIGLVSAFFTLAGFGVAVLHHHRLQELQAQKAEIAVSLVLKPDSTVAPAALRRQLPSLLPGAIRNIELLQDSTLAQMLEQRYGIALGDVASDSLLPAVLRISFHPDRLTSSEFFRFVEECHRLPSVASVSYPAAQLAALFQAERDSWQLTSALAIAGAMLLIVMQWMQFRTALPLPHGQAHLLRIWGSSGTLIRTTRSLYAITSAILGAGIAWSVALTALAFAESSSITPLLPAAGGATAAVLLLSAIAAYVREPK